MSPSASALELAVMAEADESRYELKLAGSPPGREARPNEALSAQIAHWSSDNAK